MTGSNPGLPDSYEDQPPRHASGRPMSATDGQYEAEQVYDYYDAQARRCQRMLAQIHPTTENVAYWLGMAGVYQGLAQAAATLATRPDTQ